MLQLVPVKTAAAGGLPNANQDAKVFLPFGTGTRTLTWEPLL